MDLFERYVGKVIDERYKITRIIGSGGMAVVFEAYDLVNNRPVALKLLKDDIAKDQRAVKRFINESKAISMLSHPNIVKIYAVSVKENLKYLVMELVPGITLKNYINKKGALPYREALLYTRQILKALEHAHSKGIVHRDIKPHNIMLLKNGLIKVTDFGIAKLPDAETLSSPDTAIGTVYYISPEQAEGKEIDRRSDIYSLGIVMYEMMTGVLPFRSNNLADIALKQINASPRPPREFTPSIPVGAEQIILTAMEKRPERRFQSAKQMLDCVSKLLEDPNTVFNQRKISDHDKTERGAYAESDAMKKKKKKRSGDSGNGSMLPVIIGIAAAVLVIAVIAIFFIIKNVFSDDPDIRHEIVVENYVSQMFTDELRDKLENEGYSVEIEEIYSDEYPVNTIVDQNPKEGQKRIVIDGQQRVSLKLKISSGKQSYTMPDLTSQNIRNAELKLKNFSVNVEIVYEASETVEENFVISTEPAPGDSITADQTVYLHVSTGPTVKMTTVPNFMGKTLNEATAMIKEYSLLLGEVKYDPSDTEKDKIIKQSLEVGEKVPASTKVDLVISTGPKESETEQATTVPLENYAGKNYGEVISSLDKLGIKYRSEYADNANIPQGHVIRTEPAAGTSVKIGDEIVLIVSNGPSAPETDAPVTRPPEPPATEPPATEPPATEPPATEPPATAAP